MKTRDEITKYAAPEHQPVLHWLLDRYSMASKFTFLAACYWQKRDEPGYHGNRIWVPTKEGRALYEHAKLHGGEFALPETLPVPEPEPPRKLLETHEKLSETLTLSNCTNGFWLYDETRGMNLAMKAKSSTDAFVEALTYYQRRLTEVEAAHKSLTAKVDAFVGQFADVTDED
jgi:hypothetical protein